MFGTMELICLLAPFSYIFDWSGFQQETPTTEWITSIGYIIMGAGVFWLLIPNVWQIFDRSPLIKIDHRGVELHPSNMFNRLDWKDIKGADFSEEIGRYARTLVTTLYLQNKVRSWQSPFGSKFVRYGTRVTSEEDECMPIDVYNLIDHYLCEASKAP